MQCIINFIIIISPYRGSCICHGMKNVLNMWPKNKTGYQNS